ncbi:MAG: hypothetical protein AAGG48_09415 [Planctomycetota bacterium]
MLRTPLVRLTLIGVVAGLAVGLFAAVTTPVSTGVDQVASVTEPRFETRVRTRWKLEKVPREDDPTNFIYEENQSQVEYTVSFPGGDAQYADIPVWQEMISQDIAARDFKNAITFLSGIRDESDRSDALAYVVVQISNKPLPSGHASLMAPLFVPAGEDSSVDDSTTKEELDAKRQTELVSFVDETTQELDAALRIAYTVDDHGSRAKILMIVSSVHLALGNDDEAEDAAHAAKVSFADYENELHGRWARVKRGFFFVVRWAGAFGILGFVGGLAIKVLGYYLIETAARKIGDETFAKALGTTLKTTAKESGLILPEHWRD